MKRSLIASIVAGVTVMVWLVIFAATTSVPAAAPQSAAGQAKTAASGPPPKTPWDGKPDLTGTWGPATAGPGPNHDARSPTNTERRDRGLDRAPAVLGEGHARELVDVGVSSGEVDGDVRARGEGDDGADVIRAALRRFEDEVNSPARDQLIEQMRREVEHRGPPH